MTMCDIGHEPRLEPREPKVAHQCSGCGEGIYEGESAYYIKGWGWMCEQCIASAYKVAE